MTLKQAQIPELLLLNFRKLATATNNFDMANKLGEGGFGIVYKGVIDENVRPGFKSTYVAVKELNPEGFQGDKEWLVTFSYLISVRLV